MDPKLIFKIKFKFQIINIFAYPESLTTILKIYCLKHLRHTYCL